LLRFSGEIRGVKLREFDMALYLSLKEMWRNRARYLLFSMVIALITTLVLFTAALGEGLGLGNREYIEKLNADVLVYRKNVDLFIGASRIDRSNLIKIRRVAGVQDIGSINVANVSLLLDQDRKLNIALIGVEPGHPGEPPVVMGQGLQTTHGREAIIDRDVALRTNLKVGDEFRIRSIQGTLEELYTLRVEGISDGRQYFLQPSVVVPFLTWEQIKPGGPRPLRPRRRHPDGLLPRGLPRGAGRRRRERGRIKRAAVARGPRHPGRRPQDSL